MGDSPCWLHEFDDFSMTSPTTAIASDLATWLDAQNERIHTELYQFLRIPSVSAQEQHKADMTRAAEWLAKSMSDAGL
jgi:hypothetical protein